LGEFTRRNNSPKQVRPDDAADAPAARVGDGNQGEYAEAKRHPIAWTLAK